MSPGRLIGWAVATLLAAVAVILASFAVMTVYYIGVAIAHG